MKRLVFKSFSVLIDALGCYLAVAVFLHESAVAGILLVVALKALAFLGLLYAETLALAVAIDALEAVAVGVVNHHVAVYMSLSELALVDVAVLLGQLAPAVLQVVLPGTYVDVAVLPDESTLSRTLTVEKLSGVFRAVG